MRAVVQRVLNAGVTVDGECVGRIGRGYLVLLGVGHGDTRAEADKLWGKLRGLAYQRGRERQDQLGACRCRRRGTRGVAVHAVCRLPPRSPPIVYGCRRPRCRQRALRVLPDACSRGRRARSTWHLRRRYESRLGQRRSIYHRPGHRQSLGYAVLLNRVTTGHARLSSGTYSRPGLFSYLRMAAAGCYSIRVLSILGVLSPF